jgi:hypothetical protein
VAFVSEAVNTLQRRAAGAGTDVWLQSPLYPDYYRQTFHFQTDGWLSAQSAAVYETSTETLFVGRQVRGPVTHFICLVHSVVFVTGH